MCAYQQNILLTRACVEANEARKLEIQAHNFNRVEKSKKARGYYWLSSFRYVLEAFKEK